MKWKALTVVLGVFLIGVLSGMLLGRFYPIVHGFPGQYERSYGRTKSGSKYDRKFVTKLSEELRLSEQQKIEITPSIVEARIELLTVRLGTYEHANNVIAKLEARLKPLLEPKQIEKLEEFTRMFRERRTSRRERIQKRIQSLQSGEILE